jgi:DNA-binding HxlR family transcriptional regulator
MISETDIEFLKQMRKWGWENPAFIQKHTGSHQVVMYRRLKKLMEEGYVEKREARVTYGVTPKAKKLLQVLEAK